jgi:glycerol-3-phosphate dehydrogenase
MKPMVRDISALQEKEYDLVIIGAGIFGACASWDAALRGLSVAIVDKGDFSHATSSNHFKMVHGGIRYLQHADIYRIRESSRERSALLRIAPHMIKPLPIVIPTYGHGIQGKVFLGTGILLYDLLTCDRNRGLQDERKVPWGRLLSRTKVLKLFPGIKKEGLTGGALFHDGQMYNPSRLAISFLRSAINKGADAANYVEAIGFIKDGNRITGIKAQDTISGEQLEIRGKCILNAAGPWAHRLIESYLGLKLDSCPSFSRDLAFVIKRSHNHRPAIAFSTATRDADAIMDRGGRHLFAVPWRDYTLIGVWHGVFEGTPEQIKVSRKEIRAFVDEVNAGYPGLKIKMDEISVINTGLTLFGAEDQQGTQKVSFGKRTLLIDHGREHGLEGLVTLIGVRATTARGKAEKAVDMIVNKLGGRNNKSMTAFTPICGGDIDSMPDFLNAAIRRHSTKLAAEQIAALVCNYGSQYMSVLKYVDEIPSGSGSIGKSATLKAEIVHAVREEMAQRLSDVVFRRTDLGTGQIPGRAVLQVCAEIIAREFGWDQNRIEKEIQSAETAFQTLN